MAVTRREMLKVGCAGAASFALAGLAGVFSTRSPLNGFSNQRFFSAHKDQGKHFVSAMDLNGKELFRVSTPTASHSIATHPVSAEFPKGIVIAVSRDPGAAALVLDAESGQVTAQLLPESGRHFNGHGVFSADGRLFYATQNDFETLRGVVAVYDLLKSEQVAEYPSGGQGPHELVLLGDGETLVVANGGIQTHPESGRKALNLDTMQPNLAYLDRQSGALLARHELPEKHLSIRHLSRAADDTIGLALQYKGQQDEPPVVGFQKGVGAIRLAKAPGALHWKMNLYTGSICIHPQTGIAAISCPRGNMLTFWDSRRAEFLSAIALHDVGGVALSQDGKSFIASAGMGKLFLIDSNELALLEPSLPDWPKAHWGNHLTALSVMS